MYVNYKPYLKYAFHSLQNVNIGAVSRDTGFAESGGGEWQLRQLSSNIGRSAWEEWDRLFLAASGKQNLSKSLEDTER